MSSPVASAMPTTVTAVRTRLAASDRSVYLTNTE